MIAIIWDKRTIGLKSVIPLKEGIMEKMKEKLKAGKSEREVPKENLEVAAYYHWQHRGCPNNDEMCDWVEAEKELVGASKYYGKRANLRKVKTYGNFYACCQASRVR